jgi:hypothetical protein
MMELHCEEEQPAYLIGSLDMSTTRDSIFGTGSAPASDG